jgi:SAM-dependent methyltransferase
MNDYSVLADFYDELMSEVDYAAIADCYDALIREHSSVSGASGEPRSAERGILLDLACGTGTLSVLMAQRGWDVIGADFSAEMLARAKPHPNCSYIRQDMTELDLFGTIHAAVCSLDGLNHLADESELREALRRVALFTEAGGVFVFDLNTLYKHETTLGRNTFIEESDSLYCVWQNFAQSDGEIDIILDIFAKTKSAEYNGRYTRFTEVITEKAYETDRVRELCEQVGFEVVKLCEFPNTNIKEKVVFVCRRTNRQ